MTKFALPKICNNLPRVAFWVCGTLVAPETCVCEGNYSCKISYIDPIKILKGRKIKKLYVPFCNIILVFIA